MIRLYPHFLAIAFVVLASCTSKLEVPPKSQLAPTPVTSPQQVVIDKNFKLAMGQTIYVPIYSHIYYGDRQEIFNLAATLSIRNVDLVNPIIITSVRYHDSEGKLVKQYLERPIKLGAIASTDFFVKRNDTSGGLGASFIVEWVAETEISQPIVEAVILGTDSQQGISLISPGRVINHSK